MPSDKGSLLKLVKKLEPDQRILTITTATKAGPFILTGQEYSSKGKIPEEVIEEEAEKIFFFLYTTIPYTTMDKLASYFSMPKQDQLHLFDKFRKKMEGTEWYK